MNTFFFKYIFSMSFLNTPGILFYVMFQPFSFDFVYLSLFEQQRDAYTENSPRLYFTSQMEDSNLGLNLGFPHGWRDPSSPLPAMFCISRELKSGVRARHSAVDTIISGIVTARLNATPSPYSFFHDALPCFVLLSIWSL